MLQSGLWWEVRHEGWGVCVKWVAVDDEWWCEDRIRGRGGRVEKGCSLSNEHTIREAFNVVRGSQIERRLRIHL